MDRRLLIPGAAIVIVALIAGAAPVAGFADHVIEKILKRVIDLQTVPPEPTGHE